MTNESTTDGNLNAKSTAYQPVIRYGHADRTDCSAFLALLPADHPLAISTYTLTLIGKILCYAVVAIALDLVWGYAGLLSLGHGLFLLWAVMPWGCI